MLFGHVCRNLREFGSGIPRELRTRKRHCPPRAPGREVARRMRTGQLHEDPRVKRTDLEKLKGSKISGKANQFGTPGRFGRDANAPFERREQRKLEQAQGLVPFAVKLDGDLVKQIHDLAQQRKLGLNEIVAELLKKALAGP